MVLPEYSKAAQGYAGHVAKCRQAFQNVGVCPLGTKPCCPIHPAASTLHPTSVISSLFFFPLHLSGVVRASMRQRGAGTIKCWSPSVFWEPQRADCHAI